MVIMQILSVGAVLATCGAKPIGFSYAKFSGPVSGPEMEVMSHNRQHVDYIAQPDYHFSYGVEDPKTRVLQNRKESRQGDVVKGEYSVVDPDGTLRVVRYTADKVNGFQAEVITNGKSASYGHNTPHSSHHDYHSPAPVVHHPDDDQEDNDDDDEEDQENDDDEDDERY